MIASLMMAEGREGPPHGLPSNDFLDDDQLTVSTEVATPPPALTEDMVEGALRHQPPDIERDQEPETTDLRIPPESTIVTTDGEHMSRQFAIGVSHDNDHLHPADPIVPNKVPESASTHRRPATSNYSGCNASDSPAVGSSAGHSILVEFLSAFLPSWKIVGVYPDNGFLEVRLQIPDTGARKRSAPEPEPAVNDGPENPIEVDMFSDEECDSSVRSDDCQQPGDSVDAIRWSASSVDDDTVKIVAQHMSVLKEAYATIEDPGKVLSEPQASGDAVVLRASKTKAVNFGFLGDLGHIIDNIGDDIGDIVKEIGDAIASWPGDVWQWLRNEAKSVGRIVKDTVTGVLHFFAKIGEEVYHTVLDTVHAVVGAAEWVFDKLKTGAEKLINFVEMLFQWDDIRRTKDVTHNVVRLWLQDQVDKIPQVRHVLDETIATVEGKMDEWAKIDSWSPGLGDMAKKPASGSGSNQFKNQTSASSFLADKYRDHATQLQILGDSPTAHVAEELLDELLTAVSNEGHVLGAIFTQLRTLVEQFASLAVEEILKRIAGILVDGILSSVQVVVDALLNVLCQLAQSALEILDTKIHIPVISNILNSIGVPDISFLDLFTWISAVAVTVVYKIAKAHPPFPGGDSSVKAILEQQVSFNVTATFSVVQIHIGWHL
ncbi:hypothetical protein CNMCM8980_010239 [Aspergillus fumigatiaffinis]|uniref:Uncharacterized protein n=1 Tax=Aspergillus fumigatiaffinis TaxID=340414 RepID=A0A8H4H2D1_9EURO|nr:hypothetical protein CNMCM6805_009169 [Aspergillus fumigatiaffinis]KAF4244367.1 hypothetical protein CNMCM8980_010239 [Aspergillus fumigatiaffinis]